MDFNAIQIRVASPEDILRWSHGEVLKPETINYRTQRPEKDGLFSERIFGPTKDWECYCGKYRRIRYKGVTCDKCGVEVTRAIVRRERMGHIVLAAPVVHIWFLRSAPSRIGLLLDASVTKLEKVVYYAAYIITSVDEDKKKDFASDEKKEAKRVAKEKEEAGDTSEEEDEITSIHDLRVGKVVSETDYVSLKKKYGGVFKAETGAGAIRSILESIDLKKLVSQIKKEIETSPEAGRETRLLARLKMATSMLQNDIRPEWMILTILPVLPPDLRPMVALDGGRYATSDLNDLYRRVINRNNRLKKLLELKAPDVIIRNEKRMLQEAVDSLIDNSSRLGTTQQLSSQRRPLRSLADMLKGKTGRFRQNLLGKRVDYSGRSVIVIGPNLKLNQCGLPKKMALEIFRPFVVSKIIERGLAFSIKNANRLIEEAPPEVWEILEEVIGDKKVLLNRAPTLHRLGIQAFNPLLIEELAIQIPPMVCTAFNADFDGDQMAVHLPLTKEAQKEATEKMLSSTNLLKPATGDPITTPTQDIVLGCYYLTGVNEADDQRGRAFSSEEEAILAHELGKIGLHSMTRIVTRETTVGRIIFNRVLPPGFDFINSTLNKKLLSELVRKIIQQLGIAEATQYLDKIKETGFFYASQSGISWGMDDLVVPEEKSQVLKDAEAEESLIRSQYEQGLLTDEERKARIIGIWNKAKKTIAEIVPKNLSRANSVFQIIDSGSRGSWAQPIQMMGMRGLIQDPQGETIELPVKASYKEGLGILEYFISAYGGRKGTTDTALKTASAGYLTRRLVDVAQDVMVRENDCKSKEGIDIFRSDCIELGYSFGARIFSRTALNDIKLGNKILARAGDIIDRAQAEAIDKAENIEKITVRSPITCKTLNGVCAICYGGDLGNGKPVALGEAVGIIAAQSIGEPGTQLTMRTFHVGGVAGADITHGLPRVEEVFEARSPKGKAFLAEEEGVVDSIDDKGPVKVIRIKATKGKSKKEKLIEYSAQGYVEFLKKEGDTVAVGDQLTSGSIDPKELFRLRGSSETVRYIVREIQKIYMGEGASINNKHIETIVRQMLSKSRIVDQGDTSLIKGEIVSRVRLSSSNVIAKKSGGSQAKVEPLLLGITRVSTLTDSFLSSASFQETARALVKASVEGRTDYLTGLKENVIIGRLIPAGSGSKSALENAELVPVEPIPAPDAVS